jgi:hypothetical protein
MENVPSQKQMKRELREIAKSKLVEEYSAKYLENRLLVYGDPDKGKKGTHHYVAKIGGGQLTRGMKKNNPVVSSTVVNGKRRTKRKGMMAK